MTGYSKLYIYIISLLLICLSSCKVIQQVNVSHANCSNIQTNGSITTTLTPLLPSSLRWYKYGFFDPEPNTNSIPFSVSNNINTAPVSRYKVISTLHNQSVPPQMCNYINYWLGNTNPSNCVYLNTLRYADVLYKANFSTQQNTTFDNQILDNSTNTQGWNSFARTSNLLSLNKDGFLRFNVINTNNNSNYQGVIAAIGLTNDYTNSNPAFNTINHAIVFFKNNSNQIYAQAFENGVSIPNSIQYFSSNNLTFEIIKMGNIIFYKINNIVYVSPTQVTTDFKVKACFANSIISFKDILTTFGCVSDNENETYISLTRSIDGECYNVYDVLNFKYQGEYNSGLLEYKIYTWERELAKSGSFNKNYGDNRISIPICNVGLIKDEVYTIEIKNEKGETFKTRFKFLGNNQNCEYYGNAE